MKCTHPSAAINVAQEKGLEYERQLEALVAAGAEPEECARQLRDMCSATTEGVILTLKAQVHFLRWAAVGERMISQGRGAEWAAAVQDSAALAAKGVQVQLPSHDTLEMQDTNAECG